MNNDELSAVITRHLTMLREHFDAVHIVATREMDGDYESRLTFSMGKGSIYERLGAMRDYVIKQDERTRIQAGREDRLDDEGEEIL